MTRRPAVLAVIGMLAGGLGWLLLAPAPPRFDPGRLAHLEAAGWHAYYARDWLSVLGLMVQLNHDQFGMPWGTAIAGAVDTVRASIAFAPPGKQSDVAAATAALERFYAKARQTRLVAADAHTLAALEIDYWVVHRSLALARQASPDHQGDIAPLVDALARLHAALFTAPSQAIRGSAELRAQAAVTVDRITGGYSTDVSGDWRQVEQLLDAAYRRLDN